MRNAMTIPAILVALIGATPLRADEECWVPMADWQSRDSVARLAEANGWTLRRIKIDDGCYELVAYDNAGLPIEVTVNPATLEIIEIQYEDDEHESRHDDPRGH